MGRVRTGLRRSVNRSKAWGSKHAPEILIGVGIVASIGAVAAAIKATVDIRDEWDDLTEDIDDVKARFDRDEETYTTTYYDEEDDEEYEEVLYDDEAVAEYRKDLTKAHCKRGFAVAKRYAIPVALEIAAIGTMYGSNKISRKRNATLSGALAITQTAYDRLKKNVAEEYGEEEAERLDMGIKKKKVVEEVVNKKGEVKEKVTEQLVFDEESAANPWVYRLTPDVVDPRCFHNDWKYYSDQIRLKLTWWGNILQSREAEDRGIFMNEILLDMGLEGKQIGQLWGFKYNRYDDEPDFINATVKILDATPEEKMKYNLNKIVYVSFKPRKIINECFRGNVDLAATARSAWNCPR